MIDGRYPRVYLARTNYNILTGEIYERVYE